MLVELLYLADRVDVIKDLFAVICFILFVIIIVGIVIKIEGHDIEDELKIKIGNLSLWFSIPLFVILLILNILIPSQTFIYQAIGLHIGKHISQSVFVDTKLQKVSEIVDLKLNEMIKKMK